MPHGPPQELAIHGGTPVRASTLGYGGQTIDDADVEAVARAMRDPFLTRGPRVDEFEEALADAVGARHAVSYSSGTAALHGAAGAAGLGPGKTCLTPTLTFVASANMARYQGAEVRLADVDRATWNLSGATLAAAGPADVVVPVHFAGAPCPMDELADAAGDAVVIEDAAHALGALDGGAPVGACRRSTMTCLSFHPVKVITTLEGGAVTTNDDELAARLRRFRDHGFERRRDHLPDEGPWYFEMRELGYNYRLSDVQAALGLAQLPRLGEFVRTRQELAAWYREELRELPAIELPPEAPPGSTHAYHIFPVSLRLERLAATRREVFEAMRAEGIGVQVHYTPVHRQPYYAARDAGGDAAYPVATDLYERALTLPLFPRMTEADLRDVRDALEKVTRAYAKNRNEAA